LLPQKKKRKEKKRKKITFVLVLVEYMLEKTLIIGKLVSLDL